MKKLNITEQKLDRIIEKTVKKHLGEQHDNSHSRVHLIINYLNTTSRHILRIKELLDNPDAEYMLEDEQNQHLFDSAMSLMETVKDIHGFVKSELGIHKPTEKTQQYRPDTFKGSVSSSPKAFSINERKK